MISLQKIVLPDFFTSANFKVHFSIKASSVSGALCYSETVSMGQGARLNSILEGVIVITNISGII